GRHPLLPRKEAQTHERAHRRASLLREFERLTASHAPQAPAPLFYCPALAEDGRRRRSASGNAGLASVEYLRRGSSLPILSFPPAWPRKGSTELLNPIHAASESRSRK